MTSCWSLAVVHQLRREAADLSVHRLAGGLDVVHDVVFYRLGCGVWLQKGQELLEECSELGVCLEDGEARAGAWGARVWRVK